MDQLTASQPARPVILCLSKAGLAIARRLAEVIDADIHGHAVRCPDAPHHFGKATPHIPTCSAAAGRSSESAPPAF